MSKGKFLIRYYLADENDYIFTPFFCESKEKAQKMLDSAISAKKEELGIMMERRKVNDFYHVKPYFEVFGRYFHIDIKLDIIGS